MTTYYRTKTHLNHKPGEILTDEHLEIVHQAFLSPEEMTRLSSITVSTGTVPVPEEEAEVKPKRAYKRRTKAERRKATIEADMKRGVPVRETAKKIGMRVSSIYRVRYNIKRERELAKLIDSNDPRNWLPL